MACNCNTNPCGCDSGVTFPGLTGAAGENGIFGGFSAEWKFDATTSAGPASTYLRMNDSTSADVTQIYINETNIDTSDMSTFLQTFGQSSNFGFIRLFKEYDSSQFWMGRITAVVDSGSYYTITVTHIQCSGTVFTAEDNVVVSFVENGEDGAAGTGSASVIDTVFDESTAISSGAGNLAQLSIPANTLGTDEDCLEFRAVITRSSIASDDEINISFGDQGYAGDSNEQFCTFSAKETGFSYIHIIGRIHRQASGTAHCETELFGCGITPSGDGLSTATVTAIGHSDVTVDYTQINLLQLNNTATTESAINVNSFTVKKIEKV